jgi:hypothetical protein
LDLFNFIKNWLHPERGCLRPSGPAFFFITGAGVLIVYPVVIACLFIMFALVITIQTPIFVCKLFFCCGGFVHKEVRN